MAPEEPPQRRGAEEQGPPLRAAVIGAGALGTVFAGLLDRAPGIDATLVTRRPSVAEVVARRGVLVHDRTAGSEGGSWTAHPTVATPDGFAAAGPFDVVLLLNKAPDTAWAVELALGGLAPDGIVVALQNGLRSAQLVEAADPRGVAGTTYQSGAYEDEGTVAWTMRGPTLLAPRPEARAGVDRFVQALGGAPGSDAVDGDLAVEVLPDARVMLWSKLFGAAISPVSGALLVPVYEVLASEAGREVVARAREEVLAVAEGHGVPLERDQLIGAGRVPAQAAAVRSVGSAYQSLMSGRTDEVDEVARTVVELGREVGVPTPVHELLGLLVATRLELAAR